MKILVTGAYGMLGADLVSILSSCYTVYALGKRELDIRDHMMVEKRLKDFRPEIVVHLAALTDVDYCESHPDEAIKTNTLGTMNVTELCARFGIRVYFLSSIAVFDGFKNTPYNEHDIPSPQNTYGNTKYQGEQIVMKLSKSNCVIRTGWLFGGHEKDKKFVNIILNRAKSQSYLPVICDKYGSPTYTYDLAKAIKSLIENNCSGIYHVVNGGNYCTRFQFAKLILKLAEITSCQLKAVNSDYFSSLAPRPRMEAAVNLRIHEIETVRMRDWTEALREYLQLRREGNPQL